MQRTMACKRVGRKRRCSSQARTLLTSCSEAGGTVDCELTCAVPRAFRADFDGERRFWAGQTSLQARLIRKEAAVARNAALLSLHVHCGSFRTPKAGCFAARWLEVTLETRRARLRAV